MSSRRLAFFTALAILAFVAFHMRSSYRVWRVSVLGNEAFREEVLSGLKSSNLRFVESKEADVIFDQRDSTLKLNGSIYHLEWSPEVVRKVELELERLGEGSKKLKPALGWEEVYRRIGKLLRTGENTVFDGKYLSVSVSVELSNGDVLVYDPMREVFTRIPGR